MLRAYVPQSILGALFRPTAGWLLPRSDMLDRLSSSNSRIAVCADKRAICGVFPQQVFMNNECVSAEFLDYLQLLTHTSMLFSIELCPVSRCFWKHSTSHSLEINSWISSCEWMFKISAERRKISLSYITLIEWINEPFWFLDWCTVHSRRSNYCCSKATA